MNRRVFLRSWAALVLTAGLVVTSGLLVAAAPEANPDPRAVQVVTAVQDRNTPALLDFPGVVGTATGLHPKGGLAIKVFVTDPAFVKFLPRRLENIPVVPEVTGPIVALQAEPQAKGGGGGKVSPTSRFDRPVPIGVSTGNANECSAGTISCRVRDADGNVFALSNNHVYARENNASLGEQVLQPGRYDAKPICAYRSSDVIGNLVDYQPISFTDTNTIDAAIAGTTTANLGNATPSDGYGTPKSTIVDATLNQRVQKYGRTTSLTKGTVSGVNATVTVSYSSGTATFVNQVIVSGNGFIRSGDSGSLLVTDPNASPVGLLFAANSNGSFCIANPVGPVLSRFNVTIDGN